MNTVEITLVLNGYCIETGAKKAYEKAIREFFQVSRNGRDTLVSENRIDALKFILENVNFGELRCRHKELSGAEKRVVRLCIPSDPFLSSISWDDQTVRPHWRSNRRC